MAGPSASLSPNSVAASPVASAEAFAPGMAALWPYYPHAEEQQVIDEARAVLLVSCMEERGVPITAPAVGTLEKRLAAQDEEQSVLYGISDETLVRQYGYSPSLALLAPGIAESVTPTPLPLHSPSTPEVTVEPGTTDLPSATNEDLTYCVQQAQAELYGGQEFVGTDPFSLGRDLAITAWLDSQEDPQVQSLWQDWRSCMEDAGYDPPGNPVDPQLFPVRTDGSKAPEDEVAAALTDLGCKKDLDFVTRWSTVVEQLEEQALAAHRDEIEAQRAHLDATLTRATEVVTAARS